MTATGTSREESVAQYASGPPTTANLLRRAMELLRHGEPPNSFLFGSEGQRRWSDALATLTHDVEIAASAIRPKLVDDGELRHTVAGIIFRLTGAGIEIMVHASRAILDAVDERLK